jgi:hypothetical protein
MTPTEPMRSSRQSPGRSRPRYSEQLQTRLRSSSGAPANWYCDLRGAAPSSHLDRDTPPAETIMLRYPARAYQTANASRTDPHATNVSIPEGCDLK